MEFGSSKFRFQFHLRIRVPGHLSLLLQRSRRVLQHVRDSNRRRLLAQSDAFTFADGFALAFSFPVTLGLPFAIAECDSFAKSNCEPIADPNPASWLG